MDSHDARIFIKLAETLSFKTAAEHTGFSRSAVSKRLARLEAQLGAVLINRSPRSIGLTDAGRRFLDRCLAIEQAIQDAEHAVSQDDERAAGHLRFSIASTLGASLMPRLMTEFSRQYADITYTVHFAEPFVDVIAGEYDVVIRIARKLGDSALVAQRLMTTPGALVASPGYLEEHGTPTHPRDLKKHRCMGLAYGSDVAQNWRFTAAEGPIDVPIKHAFSSNNHLALNLAACLGAGFLCTPRLHVASELKRGRLTEVLSEYCRDMEYGVYAVYPQKSPPAKVRVFVDFVRDFLIHADEHDLWNPLSD